MEHKCVRKKQIANELTGIIITILVSVVLTLMLMFGISAKENHMYKVMLDRNACEGNIYLELVSMETAVNSYGRTLNTDYFEALQDSSRRLDEYLEELKENSASRQTTMDYIRRIEGFNDYQQYIWHGDDIYSTIGYVKLGLANQKAQAQNMITENSAQTRKEIIAQIEMLNRVKWFIWLCIITVLLVCIVMMIFRTKKITYELSKNQNMAQALTAHQWEIEDAETGSYMELDNLSDAMNEMKREIKHYIEQITQQSMLEKQLDEERLENERKDKALVEAKLSALRAQVNPHFLFNAMNLISKVAFLEQPEKAMELIEAISKILRYSLDQSGRMVPLSKELEIVDAYISLQKARFGDAVVFESSASKELEHVLIPSMIIQPIIENSFKHGLKKKSVLTISLVVKEEDSHIAIYIEDDGDGFDVTILTDSSNQGIGVRNVEERLELEYKQKNLFTIDSKQGYYTKILIRIPTR